MENMIKISVYTKKKNVQLNNRKNQFLTKLCFHLTHNNINENTKKYSFADTFIPSVFGNFLFDY